MGATLSHTKPGNDAKQGDVLLWAGGVLVAVLAATWLAMTQPWSSGSEPSPAAAAPELEAATSPARAVDSAPELGGALDNPLRMAQLAFDAGMLIEPEEYSAWALYRSVLARDPGNDAARQGLLDVADLLVRRGEAALEQGRFADAQGIADRILAALPGHDGAASLIADLTGLAPRSPGLPTRMAPTLDRPALTARQPMPRAVPSVEPAPEAAPAARAPERAPSVREPQPDPLATPFAEFEAALAAGRLLTPLDSSAKHFVAALAALDGNDERTQAAREQLSRALLGRASQALATLDTAAASTWIDEAEALGADGTGVAAARAAVTDRLAAMEAARPLPASELSVLEYVTPVYPERALERGLAGWVDVEFTVAADGTTRDISVTGASHENFFRREAQEAVARWRFEPRAYLGRTIEQRSYTRIRFVQ